MRTADSDVSKAVERSCLSEQNRAHSFARRRVRSRPRSPRRIFELRLCVCTERRTVNIFSSEQSTRCELAGYFRFVQAELFPRSSCTKRSKPSLSECV